MRPVYRLHFITPQQPAKVVALVGASPTCRIGRFTTERPGACRARKGARGVSSPGIEPMGLNEDEPQLMSPVINQNRSRRIAGVMTKADVCAADNRQPAQSPAGSAWQARREGQPQIKRGERGRCVSNNPRLNPPHKLVRPARRRVSVPQSEEFVVAG